MVGSERTGNRAYHRAIIFIFAMLIITIMLTTSNIIIMLNIIIIIIIMLATTLSIIIMLTTWVFFKECSLLPITKGAQHGLLRSSLPEFFWLDLGFSLVTITSMKVDQTCRFSWMCESPA